MSLKLPPLTTLRDFRAKPCAAPSLIIEGMLHQGCKLILAGTSKSNKSWCLLDLALAVCTGGTWWGRRCAKHPVVYLNFELQPWAIQRRFTALIGAHGLPEDTGGNLLLWNLRGFDSDVAMLRPALERGFEQIRPGLIVLDPVYKLLGNRDENNNGAIGDVLRELERMAHNSGAAIALAHHFAKGDSSGKSPIDRMSGAGVWARDPDSLLIMTPDEEEPDVYEVIPILRNLPGIRPFKLEWEFPFMRTQKQLVVGAQKEHGKDKASEFFRRYVPLAPISKSALIEKAVADGMKPEEVHALLTALSAEGKVAGGQGFIWRNSTTNREAA